MQQSAPNVDKDSFWDCDVPHTLPINPVREPYQISEGSFTRSETII